MDAVCQLLRHHLLTLRYVLLHRAALKQHSARQLRLMFALHHWHKPMTYSEAAARLAGDLEAVLRNFFRSVRALTRTRRGQHFPTIRWQV